MISRPAPGRHARRIQQCSCDTCQRDATEAETRSAITLGMLGVPVGFLLAYWLDWVTAGPGLGVMVGQ
jgi:hypothetical protein